MRQRRLTILVSGIIAVGFALWLASMAGDAPPAKRPRSRTPRETQAGAGAPRVDTTIADVIADADTLRTLPYEDAAPAPSPAPLDTQSRGKGATAPKVDASDALRGPIVDTTIARVERAIEKRHLIIPVQGVSADQLVDTYTAARSEGRTHNAIDIIAPGGTPVLAAAAGTVVKLFHSERGGVTLYEIDPDGRTIYFYAHLQGYAPGVTEGTVLRQGDLVGYVGDTGNAGPGNTHLHFEITIVPGPTRYWSGVPVNPYPMLRHQ